MSIPLGSRANQVMWKALSFLFLGVVLSAEKPPSIGGYILGPGDEFVIHATNADGIDGQSIQVGAEGDIGVPRLGRMHVAGMRVPVVEAELARRLRRYLNDPVVSITISAFRSRPVSVLGAVKDPGVHFLQGRKTLYEMISMAGGLRPDAGNTINLTRRMQWGPVPLQGAKKDDTGQFTVVEIPVRAIMEAQEPHDNIEIYPEDVISVPVADIVYVIGCVRKPGGFVLNKGEPLSVLQALALAEGLDHTASASGAKILRSQLGSTHRTEIPVDVKKTLAGTAPDQILQRNDILFIPFSAPKNAAIRSLEAAIQLGTGIAIYRR